MRGCTLAKLGSKLLLYSAASQPEPTRDAYPLVGSLIFPLLPHPCCAIMGPCVRYAALRADRGARSGVQGGHLAAVRGSGYPATGRAPRRSLVMVWARGARQRVFSILSVRFQARAERWSKKKMRCCFVQYASSAHRRYAVAGPYKFTMFFNTPTGQGFSESWYYESSTPISSLPDAPFDTLAAARNNLCATFVNMVGWRISDVSDPRMTYTKNIPYTPQGTSPPDPASTAWLAIARGANGVGRRQFWMRGIRDEWVKFELATNQWEVVGSFRVVYDAFVGLLKASGSSWRILTSKSAKQSNTKMAVLSLAPSTSGNTVILTVPSSAAFVDVPIIVSTFKKPLSYLNGTYLPTSGYVAGGAGTTVVLLNRQLNSNFATLYGGGALVRTKETTLTPITNVQLDSPRSRRVGRAFFVPAGRRSRR